MTPEEKIAKTLEIIREFFNCPWKDDEDVFNLLDEITDILEDNCPCCHRPIDQGHKMDCSYRD